MKTITQLFALMFILMVQMVYGQDLHHNMEATFSKWPIHNVLKKLNLASRYANEELVQAHVDSSYSVFQRRIGKLVELEHLNEIELNLHFQSFLSELNNEVDKIDPSFKTPTPVKMLNGPCVNMDFENGDLNGWDLWIGEADGSSVYSFANPVVAGPGPNHQIYGGGVDPIVGISRVNPLSGNFSVRLGNGIVDGAGAARMSQTFLVDATNYFYTYNYAVVFENPDGHTPLERPYFTVRVYDENGANITCGEYSVYADPANATDYLSAGGVLYKNWTSVFTNLSAFIGQNVTVEFTVGDCSLGGHYGYVYLDASCALQDITATQDTICPGQTSTLTAPMGIGSYLWSTGATTQSIVVNTGGNYTCLLTPVQGAMCSVLLDYNIEMFATPNANFNILDNVICSNELLQLENTSTISAGGTIQSYRWDFGNGIVSPQSTGLIIGVPNTGGTYLSANHLFALGGLYQVELLVTSTDGCMDSITLPVTVNNLSVVVAGADQTVCFGSPVVLSGSGASIYNWSHGVVNGSPFLPAVGTQLYTLTGTDANGCQNTDQVLVTVNSLPNVNAGLDQTLCFGNQIALTANGAVAYAWNNGVLNGVAYFPPLGTTLYQVIGTDANGCQNSDQVQVTVHALPVVDAGVDQNICFGNTVTLTASGATNYVWNNGVFNGVSFTPVVGNDLYTVTGTDNNGCSAQDQVQVNVLPLPNVAAGLDQIICFGNPITLNGAGAAAFAWNGGVVNGVAFVPSVGTHIYTLTGTHVNGCTNTDQVQIVVNPLPLVDAGANQTACFGTPTLLLASGATNYIWSNGDVNGTVIVQNVGTQTYHVVGTNIFGCMAQDSITVIINPNPMVQATHFVICQGDPVILNGQGADTYTWSHGVLDGVPFYPTQTTIYTVTGTNIFNCSASAVAQVIVNDLPVADFYMTEQNFTTLDASAVFLNTSSNAVSYIWHFNDGSLNSTQTNPFHTFQINEAGEHTIMLVAVSEHGCRDSIVKVINVKDELLFFVPNTFTPDGDDMNQTFNPVFVSGFDPQAYTLYIFDRWGQIIFESHNTEIGWSGRYGEDGKVVQDGTYNWKIIVKGLNSTKGGEYVGHVNLLR